MKTSASITSEKRTDGQEKQLKRLLEDGAPKAYALLLKKLDPDKDGMDRLLGNGDEVVNAMVDAILEKARVFTTPDQYADEEASSDYRYPEEYKGPKPLNEQINTLVKIFGVSGADAIAYVEKTKFVLPEGAEGWFAILSPSAIEKLVPNATDAADRYCKGVCLVLEKIAASRRFENWREGELTPDRLRIHARTAAELEEIAKVQKGDILVIPAQLGLRHRGRSTRRACVCFKGGEFGLDPIAGGCIGLTHPERLVRSLELDMDLPGAEFAPGADGGFSGAPRFEFRGDEVRFGTGYVSIAYGYYGSASAFLSQ
jgi:hypothetical protein